MLMPQTQMPSHKSTHSYGQKDHCVSISYIILCTGIPNIQCIRVVTQPSLVSQSDRSMVFQEAEARAMGHNNDDISRQLEWLITGSGIKFTITS